MSKDDLKTAASVTIYDAPNMSLDGRKKIAKWLKGVADGLIKHNKEYAKRFTSKWQYEDGK